MHKEKFRIGADISASDRATLLCAFPPRFTNVWCKVITMAYGVTDEFEFSSVPVNAEVYGHHVGGGHEALLVRVYTDEDDRPYGDEIRPDGKFYHITLSTADRVPPAMAGNIEKRNIDRSYAGLSSQNGQCRRVYKLNLKFFRHPLWKSQSTKRAA